MNLAERRKKAEAEWENTKRLGLEDIIFKPYILLGDRYPCVYLCLDINETVIYVGRTTDIVRRALTHKGETYWRKEISKILFGKTKSETEMAIYEIYYMNKFQPKYNLQNNFKDSCDIELPELKFKEFIWDSSKNELVDHTL